MQRSSWRKQAGLPRTPISPYQQRFGGLQSATIKLAADLGNEGKPCHECEAALDSGQPIKDFSRYLPEYARPLLRPNFPDAASTS